MDNYGVIDIGSNSVRLMLVQGEKKNKYVLTTGLAKGSLNGYLQEDSMNRTIDAIVTHCNHARQEKVDELFIFATEAVRSSKNKDEFIAKVKEKTGIDLYLIPAAKEAEMGFYGAYTSGECLVLDIGGASTEIVVGNKDGIKYKKSVPIGIVRINDNVKDGKDKLEYILSMIKEYGVVPKAENYYAIGGTAGTIVAITEKLEPYDPTVTHNYNLTLSQVDYWQQKLKTMTVEEIENLKGIDKKRAEIIEGGANLLYEIMKMLGIDSIRVSENDNLEGFIKVYNPLRR